jgi:hypothetical protein
MRWWTHESVNFEQSQRSLERYVQKKIIAPEPERIDRKQVFDFFQSCYNLVNYKQSLAYMKGDTFLPSDNEEAELINKQFKKAMDEFDQLYEDFLQNDNAG